MLLEKKLSFGYLCSDDVVFNDDNITYKAYSVYGNSEQRENPLLDSAKLGRNKTLDEKYDANYYLINKLDFTDKKNDHIETKSNSQSINISCSKSLLNMNTEDNITRSINMQNSLGIYIILLILILKYIKK